MSLSPTRAARAASLVLVLTSAGLVTLATAPAATAASSADSAWFVDPLPPSVRAKEIAVPNDPDAYDGPRKHTVATLRTRAGALAVPLTTAYGHRLEAGQALVLTKKALFRFDSRTPTKTAKRQIRALADALIDVRGLTCEGYADYGGPGGNEKDLSADRARAICALVRKAAPQVGTDLASYGGNRPAVVGGHSRVARAQNRRVVLVVTNAVDPTPPPTVPSQPVNHAPVANPDTGAVPPCSHVATGNVLTNDTDPDGDSLTVTSGSTSTSNSTLVISADGGYTLTPVAAPTVSSETFTYTIGDGHGGTATGTLTVTFNPCPNVAPVNTLPSAQTTDEDTAKPITGVSVSDVDSTALTTTLTVSHGTLTVSASGATTTGNNSASVTLAGTQAQINTALAGLVYVNTPDYNGADTLTVSTSDGSLSATGTVPITVTPVRDASDDNSGTRVNQAVALDVLSNDTFENDGRSITAVDGKPVVAGGAAVRVTDGEVALNANQTLTFTPDLDFSGYTSFSYTVTSGGVTETAGITLLVYVPFPV